MQTNTTDTQVMTDNPMPKDWMQIRIERDTAAALDKIHVERREAYNDIILRLIDYWLATHDKKE